MPDNLLSQLESLENKDDFPPVHLWNPERVYDFDMRIDKDGRWIHEGSEIKRIKLVKLFASVLKKEGEDYYLVTPVEKARIQVEDVPFLIVEIEAQQYKTICRTNLDELIVLSNEHPLTLEANSVSEEVLPYVDVRSGLKARFNRNVYYQAIELAEERGGKFYLKGVDGEFCVGEV